MDPIVSVNLTTYNRAQLLPRCLNSIVSQSYENIEVIIVDDCSNDNTEQIIKDYMTKDSRIKYFRHNKNRGNAAARNTALKKCSGKYVAFMDDDDEWIDKNKLKKQVNILENNTRNNIGLVCTSINFIENNQKKEKIIVKPQNITDSILRGNGFIYSPTVMTLKKIMNEVGGFDESQKRGIDSDFYRNCIANYGYDVYVLKDITTNVHIHNASRITVRDNLEDVKNGINNKENRIKKYYQSYIKNKQALSYLYKRIAYDYSCKFKFTKSILDIMYIFYYMLKSFKSKFLKVFPQK